VPTYAVYLYLRLWSKHKSCISQNEILLVVTSQIAFYSHHSQESKLIVIAMNAGSYVVRHSLCISLLQVLAVAPSVYSTILKFTILE